MNAVVALDISENEPGPLDVHDIWLLAGPSALSKFPKP